MISCADAVRQMWEYIDGVTNDDDRHRIEEHLAFCRRCCGEAEFAEELRRFLASQEREEIPDEARRRLTAVLEELET